MATPESALSPPGDRQLAGAWCELVCSYDWNGNVLEVNQALELVTGYSRAEARGMNLSVLLEPESWELSRELLLADPGAQALLEIALLSKSGQRVRLRITRRLLLEAGRAIGVEATGYPIPPSVRPEDAQARSEPQTRPPASPAELTRFADHLKQLHRLSTAGFASLEHVFDEHLKTGIQLFGLPVGMILEVDGSVGVIRAVQGSTCLAEGCTVLLNHRADEASRIRMLAFPAPGDGPQQLQECDICVGTPILAGSQVFGLLSFSSYATGRPRTFSSADQELIELMAQSIGRLVSEQRAKGERLRSDGLEKSRNRVLQMVAERASLDMILREVCQTVEAQRDGTLCAVLLLEGETLSWTAASSFPPDMRRLLNPLRARGDASGLGASELMQRAKFWADVRHCPIWAGRGPLAAEAGVQACHVVPLRAARGDMLGLIALLYRSAPFSRHDDGELLQLASRLAATAIEQRRLHDHLEHAARHDALTGLPNRSHLIQMLDAALPAARGRPGALAVLFADLDRFKRINDTLGHATGDRVLQQVAERLTRLLTEDDLAGRTGGDEFVVVLTRQPDERVAIRAAEEFLNAFRAPHRMDGGELFVTASIGVALFPKLGGSAAELLRNADLAMHRAKDGGRNALEVFLADNQRSALERLRLENALRRALQNREFDLLYQPVVDMNGQVDGVEALLTWRHPVYGIISPNQFIPIAEETGLIVEIGSWVLQQACLRGARWREAGYRATRVSVNVSALQFERRDFVETVAAALAMSRLPARCLELELTERCVVRDLPQSVQRMSQIRALGVSIAIDDFGTGYSSLSYLNKLPVDALKIDQSFLRSMQQPDGSLPVIQSIVGLAHSLNLTVVAEGVETREELDLVRLLGCDKVQGHLYGTALPAEAVGALLAREDGHAPVPLFPLPA